MNYKKIAERLVDYKIAKREKIQDYTGFAPTYPDIWGMSGNPKENKKIWIHNLEKIVKKRHSKFKFVRNWSRSKKKYKTNFSNPNL